MATITILVALICCVSVVRSPDSNSIDPVDPSDQIELLQSIEAIKDAEIAAIAVEQRGRVIEVGFLLREVNAERSDDGRTTFEAALVNLGAFPVSNPYVTLRLFDKNGAFVEAIDLVGPDEILASGQAWPLRGEYQVGGGTPRIVEETLSLTSDESSNFTLYSYSSPKESPGLLAQIARFLPMVKYEAVYSQPDADWDAYKAQFHYDRVIRD